jgi:Na+/H+ antiporter NhaD/arsenite permease-like protein
MWNPCLALQVEGYPISFISFFKVGFPAMIMSVCIATAYLASVNSIFAPWY